MVFFNWTLVKYKRWILTNETKYFQCYNKCSNIHLKRIIIFYLKHIGYSGGMNESEVKVIVDEAENISLGEGIWNSVSLKFFFK